MCSFVPRSKHVLDPAVNSQCLFGIAIAINFYSFLSRTFFKVTPKFIHPMGSKFSKVRIRHSSLFLHFFSRCIEFLCRHRRPLRIKPATVLRLPLETITFEQTTRVLCYKILANRSGFFVNYGTYMYKKENCEHMIHLARHKVI